MSYLSALARLAGPEPTSLIDPFDMTHVVEGSNADQPLPRFEQGLTTEKILGSTADVARSRDGSTTEVATVAPALPEAISVSATEPVEPAIPASSPDEPPREPELVSRARQRGPVADVLSQLSDVDDRSTGLFPQVARSPAPTPNETRIERPDVGHERVSEDHRIESAESTTPFDESSVNGTGDVIREVMRWVEAPPESPEPEESQPAGPTVPSRVRSVRTARLSQPQTRDESVELSIGTIHVTVQDQEPPSAPTPVPPVEMPRSDREQADSVDLSRYYLRVR